MGWTKPQNHLGPPGLGQRAVGEGETTPLTQSRTWSLSPPAGILLGDLPPCPYKLWLHHHLSQVPTGPQFPIFTTHSSLTPPPPLPAPQPTRPSQGSVQR